MIIDLLSITKKKDKTAKFEWTFETMRKSYGDQIPDFDLPEGHMFWTTNVSIDALTPTDISWSSSDTLSYTYCVDIGDFYFLDNEHYARTEC